MHQELVATTDLFPRRAEVSWRPRGHPDQCLRLNLGVEDYRVNWQSTPTTADG